MTIEKVLAAAEEKVRAIASEYVAQGDYPSAQESIRVASELARLKESSLADKVGAVLPTKPAAAARQRANAARYPRFERTTDGGLVKVGWSRKKRTEYYHRASQVARDATVSACVSAGDVVVPEALFPVLAPDGEEIPRYQVYAVLAWLREARVLTEVERGQYRLSNESRLGDVVAESWDRLPQWEEQ